MEEERRIFAPFAILVSQQSFLQFIRMFEASLILEGVRPCKSGGSATATGWDSELGSKGISEFLFSVSAVLGEGSAVWRSAGGESHQYEFLGMFKFFVYQAFHIAGHFHRFYLRLIPN
jgi:hypothetical protein